MNESNYFEILLKTRLVEILSKRFSIIPLALSLVMLLLTPIVSSFVTGAEFNIFDAIAVIVYFFTTLFYLYLIIFRPAYASLAAITTTIMLFHFHTGGWLNFPVMAAVTIPYQVIQDGIKKFNWQRLTSNIEKDSIERIADRRLRNIVDYDTPWILNKNTLIFSIIIKSDTDYEKNKLVSLRALSMMIDDKEDVIQKNLFTLTLPHERFFDPATGLLSSQVLDKIKSTGATLSFGPTSKIDEDSIENVLSKSNYENVLLHHFSWKKIENSEATYWSEDNLSGDIYVVNLREKNIRCIHNFKRILNESNKYSVQDIIRMNDDSLIFRFKYFYRETAGYVRMNTDLTYDEKFLDELKNKKFIFDAQPDSFEGMLGMQKISESCVILGYRDTNFGGLIKVCANQEMQVIPFAETIPLKEFTKIVILDSGAMLLADFNHSWIIVNPETGKILLCPHCNKSTFEFSEFQSAIDNNRKLVFLNRFKHFLIVFDRSNNRVIKKHFE